MVQIKWTCTSCAWTLWDLVKLTSEHSTTKWYHALHLLHTKCELFCTASITSHKSRWQTLMASNMLTLWPLLQMTLRFRVFTLMKHRHSMCFMLVASLNFVQPFVHKLQHTACVSIMLPHDLWSKMVSWHICTLENILTKLKLSIPLHSLLKFIMCLSLQYLNAFKTIVNYPCHKEHFQKIWQIMQIIIANVLYTCGQTL